MLCAAALFIYLFLGIKESLYYILNLTVIKLSSCLHSLC